MSALGMDFGLHLPLMDFDGEGLSRRRLDEATDAAREAGFAAVSANDHFLFSTPWLDGPTALASVIERSGRMTLATTLALAVLRGPVPLAKTLAAIDLLSEGRLIAGLGPGSSQRDYDALGVPFDERWKRLDEVVEMLRALLRGESGGAERSFYPAPGAALEPRPAREVPLWLGSWGSDAGLRRVARLGDGWLASAYNTTPDRFAGAIATLRDELSARNRDPDGLPNALVTMWTWVTESRAEADRVLHDVLAPLLRREPDELAEQLCVGSPDHCAALLSRYAKAGCRRVHFWPLRDERSQVELLAGEVRPLVEA